MARRLIARLGAIAAICAVAGVTLVATSQIFDANADKKPTTLQQLLHFAERPWQVRLFPGAVNASGNPLVPGDRAVERLRDDYKGVDSRYQKNKDKSTIDAHLQSDGQHLTESQSFYPTTADGEGRHPLAKTKYKGEDQIVAQDIRRKDGTRLQLTLVSTDGVKSIVDYAEDGSTVIGEKLLDPPAACCGEGPKLKSEQRWLADKNHTLVYADITAPDGTRTKTKYDGDFDHNSILWIMKCPQRECYVSGTTVKGFYEGTHELRFDSKSTYQSDDVTYYRKDGTRWYEEQITSSSNDLTYYDVTGMKKILEQNFFRHDEIGSDNAIKMTANSVYEPFQINEFDADGNSSNTFGMNGTKVDSVDANNITLNGVFYKSVSFYFDRETSQFSWGVLFPTGQDARISVDKSNYVLPPLPRPLPSEFKIPVPMFGDDLPIPPPMSFGMP